MRWQSAAEIGCFDVSAGLSFLHLYRSPVLDGRPRFAAMMQFPGYLFIAFRPDLFGPKDVFNRRVTQLIEDVKPTPLQRGIEEIRIPSEREFRSRERALREG